MEIGKANSAANGEGYSQHQRSNLSIYVMHTLGVEGHRIVHPPISPCACAYIMYRNTLKF